MNILQVMGCSSTQYASMERYLVRKAKMCQANGNVFHVIFNKCPSSKEFVQDLSISGGHLHTLDARGIFDIAFYIRVYKIIKGNGISVVHAYFTPICHYIMIAAFFLGINRRFRTSANLPYTLSKATRKHTMVFDTYFRIAQRILSLFPKKIICRSNAVRAEFRQIGVPRKKLTVASGGTDLAFYRRSDNARSNLARELQISSEKRLIGVASRLVTSKGIDTVISSIPFVLKAQKNVILLIAGEGPEYKGLRDLVFHNKISSHVIFLGHRGDLPSVLSAFDLFVQASIAEGMSNSVLEAMSCEVPIVVSNIAPNMEIMNIAEKAGLFIGEVFDYGNRKMLANRITRLLCHDDLSVVGRNARQVVKDFFSLETRITKELSEYGV